MISRSQGSGTLALGMVVVASAMVAVTGSRTTACDKRRRSRSAPSCSAVTDWLFCAGAVDDQQGTFYFPVPPG
jgi:hypothetical protein